MSAVNPLNPAHNPQLAGILSSVPMPNVPIANPRRVIIGGNDGGFTVEALAAQEGIALGGGGSQVHVGGFGASSAAGGAATPADGAQPAGPTGATGSGTAPGTTVVATPTSGNPATTSTPANGGAGETGSPLAEAISGFGKANRGEPIRASIDGAEFGFPSFRASAKRNTAPAISWGPGWKKVEKDGLWYMEHANGSKAVPAVEFRITPKPADQVQTIKVTNGWGKKFPDGSILVFDRTEGAYRLDPKGNKHKVPLGNITIGGVRLRVFEASVVRTLDRDGRVDVFDSRGNRSTGSNRWNMAAGVGAADAGATMGGGKTEAAPSTAAGGAPGKLVGSGSADIGAVTRDVQKLTGLARQLVGEIQSGNVDPARLASLQAQLATLPSGILQAAGAAGTMTTTGTTTGQPSTQLQPGGVQGDAAGQPPAPGSSDGTTVASGGGAAPVAGVDANATTRQLAAGASVKVAAGVVPSELHGKQARFGQLPEAVQSAVATAFGSDQGAGAFAPDRLVAFAADGTVRVVDAGVVFLRHQVQVRGAGPGEDRAMTMRPGRQPGSVGSTGVRPAGTTPTVGGGGGATVGDRPGTGGVATAGGSSSATRIELFRAGGETRHVDFGGITGSFTWNTLPPKARAALGELLRSGSDAAAKAFASRTGAGWAIDPNAMIVIDAGFATFPNGLAMTRRAGSGAAPRPSLAPPVVAGGGSAATPRPDAHDATRPPVAGGGSATRPSVAPPVPTGTGSASGSGSSGVAHAHSGSGGHAH